MPAIVLQIVILLFPALPMGLSQRGAVFRMFAERGSIEGD